MSEVFKQAVKERASLEDIFRRYNVREGRGSKWVCPFHDEETPSLILNTPKSGDYYHCFGCGANGDVIKAEEELGGKGFQESLFILAERYGVPIPPDVKKPESFAAPVISKKPRTPRPSTKNKEKAAHKRIIKREYITHYDYLKPCGALQVRVVREVMTFEDDTKRKVFQQWRPATDEEKAAKATINPSTGETVCKKVRKKDAAGEFELDENGLIIFENVPVPVKTFHYEWSKGETWAGSLEGLSLDYTYNAQKWYKAGASVLLKTEGEKDAEFIQALGWNATCNNSGANKNSSENAFKNMVAGGIRELIHFADSDLAGIVYILGEMKIARAQGMERQKFVILGNYEDITAKKGRDVYDELSELDIALQEIHLDKLIAEAQVFDDNSEAELEDLIHTLREKYVKDYQGKGRFLPPVPPIKEADAPELKKFYAETDSGNAELLYDMHGRNIRWIGGRQAQDFAVWKETGETGGVWQIVDRSDLLIYTIDVFKWREDYALKLPGNSEEEEKKRKRSIQFAMTSQGGNRRREMVSLIMGDPRIRSDINDFDKNRFLFNCKNGTYDLKAKEFRAASRNDLCLKQSGTSYDPLATCPLFKKVINTSMTVKEDGEDKICYENVSFLQRWFGYNLTGDVGEEIMVILYGPKGRNGKTKLSECIMSVMGDYADPAPSDMLVAKDKEGVPTDMADLQGRRFVVISEPEANAKLAVSKMKLLIGGDTIKCRRMGKDFYKFSPTHKLTMLTNEKPRVNSTEPNVWDKILLVSFLYMIPKSARDKKLSEKLEAEKSGVLNWLIEGCHAWQEKGLEPPERILNQGNKWKKDEDILNDFIEDELHEADRKTRLIKKDLHKSYMDYSEAMGVNKPYEASFLGRLLKRRGWEDGKSGSVRFWIGWRLKNHEEKRTEKVKAQNDGFEVDIKGLDEDNFNEGEI